MSFTFKTEPIMLFDVNYIWINETLYKKSTSILHSSLRPIHFFKVIYVLFLKQWAKIHYRYWIKGICLLRIFIFLWYFAPIGPAAFRTLHSVLEPISNCLFIYLLFFSLSIICLASLLVCFASFPGVWHTNSQTTWCFLGTKHSFLVWEKACSQTWYTRAQYIFF